MTTFVALLRGIGPMNPAMRNENLRRVCEELGLDNVTTVISSGNVVFTTHRTSRIEIEAELEEAWPRELGFESRTILRTREELEGLVELAPFGDLTHGPQSYLLVTFLKYPLETHPKPPPLRDNAGYQLTGTTGTELFTVTDTTVGTPDVMTWLEQVYGKDLSSRTWLTVHRILKRMRQVTN